jgi:EF hand
MNQLMTAFTAITIAFGAQGALAKGTDQDGDGRFSKAEITQKRQEQLDKKFAALDVNQDGQLTADELNGKRGIAKKSDANSDGVITKAEAKAQMTQNIDKYLNKKDMNKDGFVDKEERAKSKSKTEMTDMDATTADDKVKSKKEKKK